MRKPHGSRFAIGPTRRCRAGAAKRIRPLVRERGKKDTVALTSDYHAERLRQLAVIEGLSIQTLAVLGRSLVFREKGLPAIKDAK